MAVSANLLPRCLAFILVLFVLYCSSGAKVVTIDVQVAKNLIQTGHIYLDVRTVEEFGKGHVDAAKIINIPYLLDTPKGRVKNLNFLNEVSSSCNKEDCLIVGCQSGKRSLSAASDLVADEQDKLEARDKTKTEILGFKNVHNMGGGYMEWVSNKFPVIHH